MTRPRLQVVLAAEEDRTLLELRTASSVPQRTKDRAEVLGSVLKPQARIGIGVFQR